MFRGRGLDGGVVRDVYVCVCVWGGGGGVRARPYGGCCANDVFAHSRACVCAHAHACVCVRVWREGEGGVCGGGGGAKWV